MRTLTGISERKFGKFAGGGFRMAYRRMEEGSGLGWEGKPMRKQTHLWPQPSNQSCKGRGKEARSEWGALDPRLESLYLIAKN